ncbi:hypothetical protein QE152_g14377 [Popillia japonica]|uniref:Uncharacterized protein n=1 Tax=Popillia japonica TaxID=7064 RepID=A0AAW1L995_POPJA
MAMHTEDEFDNFQEQTQEKGVIDLAKMVGQLMVENQKRDQILDNLLSKLTLENQKIYQLLFDGNRNKAEVWLKNLDSAQILHELPDNYMLETARTRMIEAAYQWYWTKTREIHTWQDFRDNFKKTFIKEESMTSKVEEDN